MRKELEQTNLLYSVHNCKKKCTKPTNHIFNNILQQTQCSKMRTKSSKISKNMSIRLSLTYIVTKFFQGGYRTKMKIRSVENEKQVGKFFARKKRGSQIFRLRRAFFVVEALKPAKKPLKTAKNGYIFLKTSIF